MTEEIIRGSRRIGSTVKNVQWFRRQPTGGTEYRRTPDPEPHATLGAVTDHMGGSAIQREVERLQARLEQITYALLCVGPADLSITSRTQSIGRGQIPSPEEVAAMEGWLQNELAAFATREALALLAKPEFVLDHNGRGNFTLTVLAPTVRWDALRWPENPGQRGNQG